MNIDDRAFFDPATSESQSAKRPTILYLTHRVPHPPNRGDRIRSYHTLRFLARRATVDLACLADEPVSDESLATLQGLCRRVAIAPLGKFGRWSRALGSLARGRSATERLFYSPELFRTIAGWSRDSVHDAVLAFCSSMSPYLDAGRLPQSPTIVDLVDVDSEKWFDYADRARPPLRWLFWLEGGRVRRLEQSLVARSKATYVVSEDEARLLRQFCPAGKVRALPNGVDLGYFENADTRVESAESECVFVGALDYRANIDGITWFCREVWPQVYAAHPTALLRVVGRRPSTSVRRLEELPGVEVRGDVPDVRPFLRSARIAIIPLRIARGIQNKVLEAMASGCPVIASPQALEGIDAAIGEHVYKAETPAQWLGAISRLLQDGTERQRLGAAGQEFVRRHNDWEKCLQPMEELLRLPRKNVLSPVLAT